MNMTAKQTELWKIADAEVRTSRKGGSVKSERKSATSAENGRKGGRPPMTKQELIDRLNEGADPKSMGFLRQADDGANEYWVRARGATMIRLNRFEDEESGRVVWDDDVTGWEK